MVILMTTNQIAYQKNLLEERNIAATEARNATEAEKAKEQARHNLAEEAETKRRDTHKAISDYIQGVGALAKGAGSIGSGFFESIS